MTVNLGLGTGAHWEGRENFDVEAIRVINEPKIDFLPQGIDEIFPNLLLINFARTGLKEIHQSDLRKFPKLKDAAFYLNSIESMEEDLFKFNPDLEAISFYGNKISYIHPNVFDGLEKLRYLDFFNNTCNNEFQQNHRTHEEVLEAIDRITFSCSMSNGRILDLPPIPVDNSNQNFFVVIFAGIFLLMFFAAYPIVKHFYKAPEKPNIYQIR